MKYNFGDARRYKLCAVYNGMLICEKNSVVRLISTNNKPKTIYDGTLGREVIYIFLRDNDVIVELDNSHFYSYNLETGKFNNNELLNDISRAVYKLGDKYLCIIGNNEYFNDFYDLGDILDGAQGFECYYWSSVEDVNANKHNFKKIKNQPIITDYYEYYPYVNY